MSDHLLDYVEFNVADIDRARKFYGDAFGWSFTDYGPEYCEFTDGVRKGGFAKGAVSATGGPLVVLKTEDLDDSIRRIEAAGGTIVKPIFAFPGGRRFHFRDPDGYELGVWSES